MIDQKILFASAVAAYLYVVSPGPAFLALFTLAASKGRAAGAWFICGHLVGDVTWGVACGRGDPRRQPARDRRCSSCSGAGCGLYLIYLGARAVMTHKDAPPRTIGARRPLATGLAFGLTNPKAYPVALAMFSAIVAPYVARASPRRRAANAGRGLRRLPRRRRDADLRRRAAGGEALLPHPRRHRDARRRPDIHRLRRQVALPTRRAGRCAGRRERGARRGEGWALSEQHRRRRGAASVSFPCSHSRI